MTIKDLCKLSHSMAKEKGFWTDNPNISEKLMLCVTELSEACEALRKGKRQGKKLIEIKKKKVKVLDNGVCLGGFLPYTHSIKWEKDTFEDEIADTFIRLADLCQYMDIDIEWQIEQKMKFNQKRPTLHGKAF